MPGTGRPDQTTSPALPQRATVSATLAANEALARKRREGIPVLPLAFGEAGLPVHPALGRELAASVEHNEYGPVAGAPVLRTAAAGYWSRRGLPTDPGLLVCGPGSKALLFGLSLTLGGDVAMSRPSWVSYAAQAGLAGAGAVLVPTRPGEGGVPDPALLADEVVRARAEGRDLRSVVVTIPDNPTGTMARPETVRDLCAVAREYGLVIISDEIYRDLVHAPDRVVPTPAAFAPERTVVTTALSKNLALGGWRLGVARLPDSPFGHALRDELLGVVSEIWSSAPAPIQHAAAFAFTEPPELVEHIARSRRLHAGVAAAVAECFAEAGASVPPPEAAFYVYPDLEPLRERLEAGHRVRTGADLSALLLDGYGVGVLAGSAFGEPADALRLRVATSLLYGETDEERLTALHSPDPASLPWISAALDRLREVLSDITATAPGPAAVTPAVARPRPGAVPGVATA
ncbi:pyridoxal phosphate-dependent aminotransferase [Actinomadura alba]|uniref:pyridoxal phosphate-dependent aminotransferase n=1 Tax=Actinomadura alba TaxID=406431 RepID=UPI0031DD6528